ncbi:MAG: hypothetical protein EPO63_07835, partial [Candidatus Nitrosotenuis sp.]
MKKSKIVIGGVIVAVIIAVVFAVGTTHQPAKQGIITQEIDLPGPKIGSSAPDFTLSDPQKGTITKQSFDRKP